ncbi:MAG: hypothetical protein VX100_19870 [Pseudomonadota bacterium]|nr:hypothetical protein [Pseudomonadota bacterium]
MMKPVTGSRCQMCGGGGFAQGATLCLVHSTERVLLWTNAMQKHVPHFCRKKMFAFYLYKLDMFNHRENHHQKQIKNTAPPKIKVTTPGQTKNLFTGKQMEVGTNRHKTWITRMIMHPASVGTGQVCSSAANVAAHAIEYVYLGRCRRLFLGLFQRLHHSQTEFF